MSLFKNTVFTAIAEKNSVCGNRECKSSIIGGQRVVKAGNLEFCGPSCHSATLNRALDAYLKMAETHLPAIAF